MERTTGIGLGVLLAVVSMWANAARGDPNAFSAFPSFVMFAAIPVALYVVLHRRAHLDASASRAVLWRHGCTVMTWSSVVFGLLTAAGIIWLGWRPIGFTHRSHEPELTLGFAGGVLAAGALAVVSLLCLTALVILLGRRRGSSRTAVA